MAQKRPTRKAPKRPPKAPPGEGLPRGLTKQGLLKQKGANNPPPGTGTEGLISRIAPRDAGGGGPERAGGRRIVGMGWRPDIPDNRDWGIDAEKVRSGWEALKWQPSFYAAPKLPETFIDNIDYCPPVEDQGNLGSCTAQAVVGMMEYMMRRSGREHVDGSRLFLYKVTRKLLGWTGDTGAYLRTTLQAAAVFGVPPEAHWPYEIARFEDDPEAFLYSYASNYQALNYVRLDQYEQGESETLNLLKQVLHAGFVAAFGFPVYSSLQNGPDIPYPRPGDTLLGGHAILAVGYDDTRRIDDCQGALLIRNSWSEWWGAGGYGWLPYAYVQEGLAVDIWTIFKQEWIDPVQFQ
jgi:hypothetical protein